ncbi:MAG TPA: hypothetical protein VFP72_01235 [Kineosporiaceae bacterium]|nr:hypothetical protein [Kineosporiaceae bacterium]
MNDRADNQATQPVPDTVPWSAEAAPERDPAERVDAALGRRSRFWGRLGEARAGSPADSPAGQGIPPVARDGSPADAVVDPVPDGDLDLLGPAWTPQRRINRLTLVLTAGLVAALGFAGGVLVQKQHDAGLAGPSAAGAAGRTFRGGAGGQGFGGQGFGGQGGGAGQGFGGNGSGTVGSGAQGPGGSRGAAGSGPSGADAGGGSGTAAGAPVVVGKVVSVAAGTVVVENFAGTRVTVHVGATTPVTAPGVTGLQVGATVSVTGDKAADGSVNATSVVSRGAGNG